MAKYPLAGTAEIAAPFFVNIIVPQVEIPDLIRSTQQILASLEKVETPISTRAMPAVPIKASVTPDYLVSLENGRSYRTLIRHLRTLGLTPMQYRTKWGLPLDYPMVASNYTRQRSDLAWTIGLGTSNARKRGPSGENRAPSANERPPRSAPVDRQQGRRVHT